MNNPHSEKIEKLKKNIRRDPAGNIKMDKEKSTEKIDGSVATVMALDRAIRCGCETADSVYDTREMILL